MTLVVISYPKIDDRQFRWIQSVRKEYDELYFNVINPHFTFVFPLTSVSQGQLIQHIANQLIGQKQIDFILTKAIVEKDAFIDYTHTFLVPDKGYDTIVKLHDKLYTGILEPELRRDIPYIPHIGIGNDKNPQVCKKLTNEINWKKISIAGRIGNIDIAEYKNDEVVTIERLELFKRNPKFPKTQ